VNARLVNCRLLRVRDQIVRVCIDAVRRTSAALVPQIDRLTGIDGKEVCLQLNKVPLVVVVILPARKGTLRVFARVPILLPDRRTGHTARHHGSDRVRRHQWVFQV